MKKSTVIQLLVTLWLTLMVRRWLTVWKSLGKTIPKFTKNLMTTTLLVIIGATLSLCIRNSTFTMHHGFKLRCLQGNETTHQSSHLLLMTITCLLVTFMFWLTSITLSTTLSLLCRKSTL